MSKQAIAWGKWAAIISLIAGAVTVVGWMSSTAGKMVDISRTPERETKLEQRVDNLAKDCETNFMMIHAELRQINRELQK